MGWARTLAAIGCLTVGTADVVYLDVAVVPAVLGSPSRTTEVTSDEGRAGLVPAVTHTAATQPTETAAEPAADTAAAGAAPRPAPVAGAQPAAAAETEPDTQPEPADTSELPRTPSPAPAQAAPVALVIHFDRDSAHLRSSQRRLLARAVSLLGADPTLRAVIDGHADSQGEAQHNEDLSRHRADRVADFLARHDIDRERLTVRAFGETRPLDPAQTDGAYRKNRRVEIHIAVPAADDGGAQ